MNPANRHQATLSSRALNLIPKANLLGLPGDPRLSATHRHVFSDANQQRRHLSAAELRSFRELDRNEADMVGALQPSARQLVDHARRQLLLQDPGLVESGGALYPPYRAEACWRDLWHFQRCVFYGAACGIEDFTSPRGVKAMRLLYRELRVPLQAMVEGLLLLRNETLAACGWQSQPMLQGSFNHLIGILSSFSKRQGVS